MDAERRNQQRKGIPWRSIQRMNELAEEVERIREASARLRIDEGGWNLRISLVVTHDLEVEVCCFSTVWNETYQEWVADRRWPGGSLFDSEFPRPGGRDSSSEHLIYHAFRETSIFYDSSSGPISNSATSYMVGLSMLQGLEPHPGVLRSHLLEERL